MKDKLWRNRVAVNLARKIKEVLVCQRSLHKIHRGQYPLNVAYIRPQFGEFRSGLNVVNGGIHAKNQRLARIGAAVFLCFQYPKQLLPHSVVAHVYRGHLLHVMSSTLVLRRVYQFAVRPVISAYIALARQKAFESGGMGKGAFICKVSGAKGSLGHGFCLTQRAHPGATVQFYVSALVFADTLALPCVSVCAIDSPTHSTPPTEIVSIRTTKRELSRGLSVLTITTRLFVYNVFGHGAKLLESFRCGKARPVVTTLFGPFCILPQNAELGVCH